MIRTLPRGEFHSVETRRLKKTKLNDQISIQELSITRAQHHSQSSSSSSIGPQTLTMGTPDIAKEIKATSENTGLVKAAALSEVAADSSSTEWSAIVDGGGLSYRFGRFGFYTEALKFFEQALRCYEAGAARVSFHLDDPATCMLEEKKSQKLRFVASHPELKDDPDLMHAAWRLHISKAVVQGRCVQQQKMVCAAMELGKKYDLADRLKFTTEPQGQEADEGVAAEAVESKAAGETPIVLTEDSDLFALLLAQGITIGLMNAGSLSYDVYTVYPKLCVQLHEDFDLLKVLPKHAAMAIAHNDFNWLEGIGTYGPLLALVQQAQPGLHDSINDVVQRVLTNNQLHFQSKAKAGSTFDLLSALQTAGRAARFYHMSDDKLADAQTLLSSIKITSPLPALTTIELALKTECHVNPRSDEVTHELITPDEATT